MSRSIGLYVHIPFCQHKCSYCDFYSVVSLRNVDRFVAALQREIVLYRDFLSEDVIITSIFWGGGTPSLMTLEQTARIAGVIVQSFRLAEHVEWTVEANPGTIDRQKLLLYRELGINRISFGVQSFDATELRFLERIHSADDAIAAVEIARDTGFDNINIDLMYGLPCQQARTYRQSLETACKLGVEHISAYSLVYEQGTPLYHKLQHGMIVPLSEEEEFELYAMTVDMLSSHEYKQYEVSNFARPGKQCAHNLCYWRCGEYLGVGPSAHSHMDGARWSNVRSVERYCELLQSGSYPIAHREQLTTEQQRLERLFLGMRSEGVKLEWLLHECRHDMLVPMLERWCREGLATVSDDHLCLTWRGYFLCDALTLELLRTLEQSPAPEFHTEIGEKVL